MDRWTGRLLHRVVADEAEQQTQNTDENAGEQDLMAGEPEEAHLVEIREPEVHLTARPVLRRRLGSRLLGEGTGTATGASRPEQQGEQHREYRTETHHQKSPGNRGGRGDQYAPMGR